MVEDVIKTFTVPSGGAFNPAYAGKTYVYYTVGGSTYKSEAASGPGGLMSGGTSAVGGASTVSSPTSPFKSGVTQGPTEAGFKPEASQPKPSPAPEAKKPSVPQEMNLPEATAERYSTPVMPQAPMPLKKEVKEKAEQAGFRPEGKVALAYRPPEYAMTSEPASAYLERVMATPKILPSQYTEIQNPTLKEGLLSYPAKFSAGQMQMVEQLPFLVVVAPAMAAYTVLKPQAVLSSMMERPIETAGALSLPMFMKGAGRVGLKLKAGSIPVSEGIEVQQVRYFEGAETARGGSKGVVTVGKGERKVLYTYETQTTAKVKELTARQSQADSVSAISMKPLEGGKEIRAFGAARTAVVKIEEITTPETFRTYSVGRTYLASEKTGMPIKPEAMRGRGGLQKAAELSPPGAENLMSVGKYKGIDVTQGMKTASASISDITVARIKPPSPPITMSLGRTVEGMPRSMLRMVKPDIATEARMAGTEAASKAAKSRGIKQAREQYAGYEPLKTEDVRTSFITRKEEQFLGESQRRDVFTEPRMASERLASMGQMESAMTAQFPTVMRVPEKRAGQFQLVISRIAQGMRQQQVQVQQQKLKLRQPQQQMAKTVTVMRMPSMPRVRAFVPRPSMPSMGMGRPSLEKGSKFRIGKPDIMKGRSWSFGSKARETGLADVVYGIATGRGKPVATGAYGFAIRPRRRGR